MPINSIQVFFSLAAIGASGLINSPPVEARLYARYKDKLAQHKQNLPRLSPLEAAIVSGLKRDGVALTSLAALGVEGSDGMLEAACLLGLTYAERARTAELKKQDTISAAAIDLFEYPELFLWGLKEPLLKIVEAYLGLPVAYDGVNLYYTLADGKQVGTRRWHRDREDRRMVKIAVYIHDVDSDGGPLQIVKRKYPARKARYDFIYRGVNHEHLEDRLGEPLGGDDIATCTGRTGTVIFCDTASHYHRGKPAVSKDRCALFYSYFSRTPSHPFFCERTALSRSQIMNITQNLPERYRDMALWFENPTMAGAHGPAKSPLVQVQSRHNLKGYLKHMLTLSVSLIGSYIDFLRR